MAIEPPTMTEADQAALRLAVEMTRADPDHGGRAGNEVHQWI
jgi:hypothetical protein